jgi:hypothetical protein
MKIGITGTRSGMTVFQFNTVQNNLRYFIEQYPDSEFHHGDCVGVDVQAAEIAQELGYKTIAYPSVGEDLRAWHKSDIILEPNTNFARNRAIVQAVDLLFVVPYQMQYQNRGGTWYTHDYAEKIGRNKLVFYPAPTKTESYDLGNF